MQSEQHISFLEPRVGDEFVDFKVRNPGYKPLDPQKKEIRLIKFVDVPTSVLTSDMTIAFELIPTNLASCPPYTALSYVWDPAIKESVRAVEQDDGFRQLRLNGNLWVALGHLQEHYGCDYVWADAICINQEDTLERSEQVAQMCSVYQKADRVIAWLGHLPVLEHSVQDLKDWAQADMSNDSRLVKNPGDLEWLQSTHRKTPTDKEDYYREGLPGVLLQLDYWRRAWICQEIAVARTVRFAICKESFSLEELMHAKKAWRHVVDNRSLSKYISGLLKDEADPDDVAKQPTPEVEAYFKSLCDWNPANNMIEMVENLRDPSGLSLHTMEKFSLFNAADPRDLIFALWGFVDHGSQHAELLKPNYELDISTVFTNAAAYFIQHEGSLNILKCRGIMTSVLQLPSWVPDWGCRILGSIMHTEAFDRIHKATMQHVPFNDSVKISKGSRYPFSLSIAGSECGRIVKVIGTKLFPFSYKDGDEEISLKNFAAYVLYGDSDGEETALRRFTLLLDMLVDVGQEGQVKFLYTKIHWRCTSPEGLHIMLPEAGESFEPSKYWANVMANRLLGPRASESEVTTLTTELIARASKAPRPWWVNHDQNPEFNFFVTSNGTFGACNKRISVAEDDLICHIKAHPELFVLRKEGDTYRPIGECLVGDPHKENSQDPPRELGTEVHWFNLG